MSVRKYPSTLRKIPKYAKLVLRSTVYYKCGERMLPVDIGVKALMPHHSVRFVLYIANRGFAVFVSSVTDLRVTTGTT
jgi:hypothetical protein